MEHDARIDGHRRSGVRLALLVLLIGSVVLFLLLGGADLLTLEQLKVQREALAEAINRRPLGAILLYGIAYVVVVALSLPGAALMTLAAGALFGLFKGVVLVSVAATTGATLAMLAARFVARNWVRRRFPKAAATVDAGIARDGDAYLLALRLAPIFPYFLVNLVMGLTNMPAMRFAALTAIGALPGTIAYTFAGTALAEVDSLSEIASPQLIGALLLLAVLPLFGKWAARRIASRRARKGYRRPRQFDANLLVIGAGSAGLVAALVAREVGAGVILVERGQMGGDCLNTGCVPSKSLIRAAKAVHEAQSASRFGVHSGEARVDFPRLTARIDRVISGIAPNDSVERYRSLGVDVRRGSAHFIDPWTVELDGGERVSARQIVVATGALPVVPPIPGLETSGFVTSETLWARLATLDRVPERVVILGAGPIGCELGQALARLGSAVTLVADQPRLLPREDEEAGVLLRNAMEAAGIVLRLGSNAAEAAPGVLTLDDGDRLSFDLLLVAAGRRPDFSGLGLEAIGVDLNSPVHRQVREPWPHIRFAGDAAGGPQFTHFAGHSGAVAAIAALAAPLLRLKTDPLVPRVTYTDPEIASIGLSEQQVAKEDVRVEVVRFDLGDLDRARIDGAGPGFIKLLLRAGSDRVLGVTIVGPHAGELIVPWILCMRRRIGLKRMLSLIYPYPGYAEIGRAAAGKWRRTHKPELLLSLAERWFRWRRG